MGVKFYRNICFSDRPKPLLYSFNTLFDCRENAPIDLNDLSHKNGSEVIEGGTTPERSNEEQKIVEGARDSANATNELNLGK